MILFFSNLLIAGLNIPTLTRYVTDQTNTLTQSEIGDLEYRLKTYDDTTSNQIVVLIISTLEGEDLFDYSIQVAEKNKIGRKGKDNGILILVVKDDRKIRIEVGYGLEGVVPDAVASSIIRNIIIPYFKAGNYYEGLRKGIETLQDAIAGTYKAENKGNNIELIMLFAFIIVFIIFVLIVANGSKFSRGGWVYYDGGWHSYPKRSSTWGGFGGLGGFSGGDSGGFSGGGGSFGGGGASGSW